MYANDVFTLPVNLAGLPGLSIPCGLDDGLPVGFQVIGPAFSENRLLAIGHALEQAIGFDPVPPRLPGGGGVSDWEAVIGLEIHVQLRTVTKMFCRCPNRYGDAPNTNVCAICLAHPGMLPVANREAVDQALRVGLALGCRMPEHSKWDRKNYFYPDSPKAYQISQYDEPLCAEGRFLDVGITRAHLEEDAAKTIHVGGGGGRIAGSDASIVDFNRCGTPLLEIVTEPDLRDAAAGAPVPDHAARDGDRHRRLRLRPREGLDARRRQRVGAAGRGETAFGTKCELKNMNSFRFLERGINAEIRRQIALLEAGERVVQATMHYDPAQRRAVRAAHEGGGGRLPLLPGARPGAGRARPGAPRRAARGAAELPLARIARLQDAYGVPEATAESLALDADLTAYFEDLAGRTGDARASANWVMGELAAHLNATGLDGDGDAGHGRAPGRPRRRWWPTARSRPRPPSRCSRRWSTTAPTRPTLTERLGLAQVGDVDALGAIVDEVLQRTRTRSRRSAAASSS